MAHSYFAAITLLALAASGDQKRGEHEQKKRTTGHAMRLLGFGADGQAGRRLQTGKS